MATLATINETLIEQTSSIEDGTRTTESLKERFGQFIDRQVGSAGDDREQEIKERQKESRKSIIANSPKNFSAGLTQGLGFGGGLGFGALAQKILAGMGIAMGGIGFAAGKLLSFAPAIAVFSKFGEQAISGLVDYVEDTYFDGKQLAPASKKDLVDGVQTALGARLLGVKSPLGLAIAGIVGAYGDTAITAINEKFGEKDGVYTIPGTELDIDTQSEAFISALGVTLSLVAPALLRVTGKGLLKFLGKVGAGRAAVAMGVAVASMLGLKNPFAASGKPPPIDEIKSNKKPVQQKSSFLSKIAASANASRMLTLNSNSAMDRGAASRKKVFAGFVKPTVKRNNLGRFEPLGKTKADEVLLKTIQQRQARLQAEAVKNSSALKKTAGFLLRAAGPLLLAVQGVQGATDENLNNLPDSVAAGTNILTANTLGVLDLVQNAYATLDNISRQAMNFGLNAVGAPEDYRFGMATMSDLAGDANKFINNRYTGPSTLIPPLNSAGTVPEHGLPFTGSGMIHNDLFDSMQIIRKQGIATNADGGYHDNSINTRHGNQDLTIFSITPQTDTFMLNR